MSLESELTCDQEGVGTLASWPHDSGEGHSGLFLLETDLGWAPQLLRTTWAGTERDQPLSRLHTAYRKQLFTWVRCSAGPVASSWASLSLQCLRPPRKLGCHWGAGGVGGQLMEAARSYL